MNFSQYIITYPISSPTAKDHCKINNGGCSHFCRFSQGHTHCFCPKGYELGHDQLHCKGRNS